MWLVYWRLLLYRYLGNRGRGRDIRGYFRWLGSFSYLVGVAVAMQKIYRLSNKWATIHDFDNTSIHPAFKTQSLENRISLRII